MQSILDKYLLVYTLAVRNWRAICVELFYSFTFHMLAYSNLCWNFSLSSVHLRADPNLFFLLCKYENDPFIIRGYKHERLICFIAYELD